MSSHTFHPSHRKDFLDELQDVAKKYGCYGSMKGTPALPKAKNATLTVNQILLNIIRMGSADRMRLPLEIGANPKAKFNQIPLVKLAEAFAQRYNDPAILDVLTEYGVTLPKKHRAKKST